MNATPMSVPHVENETVDQNTRPVDSDNLEFAAQAILGLKVLLGIVAVVAATQGISTVMIWLYPYWAHLF